MHWINDVPETFWHFLPCASHIMPWSITSYESQMKRSSHSISFMQNAWCKMVTWSFVSFCFKSTIFCKTPIPRKIMLSPYAKKCFVFNHIFRTKCWYWANTSTLSLSACKQSAGIGSIPALCMQAERNKVLVLDQYQHLVLNIW